MKVSKLFLGLFGLLALASCSEEKDMPKNPGEVTEGDSRFMSVTIRNSQDSRAAAGEQDGNLYEVGFDWENQVSSLRFYFFDAEGNGVAVKSDGTSYYDCSQTDLNNPDQDMPNVEKILKALIVINTESDDNIYNLKYMVAVANADASFAPPTSKKVSFAELQAIVADYGVDGKFNNNSYTDETLSSAPKFVMTSSVYGSDIEDCAAEISASKIKKDSEEAVNDPVDVYIERVVAKVRVSCNWDSDMEIETVTYDGKQYTAIPLKNNRTDKSSITANTDGATTGEQVYVIFTGWRPTGLTKTSYAFKNVNSSWTLGWNWNDPNKYRSYWAINPAADGNLTYFRASDATGKFGTVANSTGATYNGDFYYVQENAASKDNVSGEKESYDADSELSNRTQVYLGAILVTVKDGVATPLELTEWGGSKYSVDGLTTAILNVLASQVFVGTPTEETTEDGEGNEIKTTKWEFSSLDPKDVEVVSYVDIKNDLFDAENDNRYLSYLQLTADAAKNKKFFSAADKDAEISADKVNEMFLSLPGAKAWKSGLTYYYTDIQHESTAAETKGKYGIVRNHIYEIELNSVYGLGTPIYDPKTGTDEEVTIIPQKPDPDYAYIGARVNILSWRVVKQSVDLDW